VITKRVMDCAFEIVIRSWWCGAICHSRRRRRCFARLTFPMKRTAGFRTGKPDLAGPDVRRITDQAFPCGSSVRRRTFSRPAFGSDCHNAVVVHRTPRRCPRASASPARACILAVPGNMARQLPFTPFVFSVIAILAGAVLHDVGGRGRARIARQAAIGSFRASMPVNALGENVHAHLWRFENRASLLDDNGERERLFARRFPAITVHDGVAHRPVVHTTPIRAAVSLSTRSAQSALTRVHGWRSVSCYDPHAGGGRSKPFFVFATAAA